MKGRDNKLNLSPLVTTVVTEVSDVMQLVKNI